LWTVTMDGSAPLFSYPIVTATLDVDVDDFDVEGFDDGVDELHAASSNAAATPPTTSTRQRDERLA